MENQQNNLMLLEEEEEEEVALQGRQSKHLGLNNSSSDTAVVVSEDGNGNDNGNGNGNGHASPISRSTSSTTTSEDVDDSHAANGSTNAAETEKDGGEGDYVHNSVYFDQAEGIWKCRHCDWTYRVGIQWTDHIQNHRGHLHVLTNVKRYNQQEPNEGAEPVDGVSDMKATGASFAIYGTDSSENSQSQDILSREINIQSEKLLDNNGFSGSSVTPLEDSVDEQSIKSQPPKNAATLDEDTEIIEELVDEEGTDYDIENVLEKQTTHELYCPNCHSCITRKVVLRRRRRKIITARRKQKSGKLGKIAEQEEKKASSTVSANDQRHDTETIARDGGPTPAADDYNDNREQPDVFRCLSCFSFFIPTGNGFKLFRSFGDNTRNANVQDSQSIPASKPNWFFSIFSKDKRKATIDQANATVENPEERRSNQNISSSLPSNVLPHGTETSPVLLPGGVKISTGKPAEDTYQYGKGSFAKPQQGENDSGLDGSDSYRPQQGGVDSHLPSTHISVTIGQSNANIDNKNIEIAIGNEKPVQNGKAPSVQASSMSTSEGGLSVDAIKGTQTLDKVKINIEGKASSSENKITGNDVMITIEKEPRENTALTIQNVDGSVDDIRLPLIDTMINTDGGEPRGAGTGAAREWEVLKSIVYGGLIESITSLGVVSSAAGSGATTLNVLALGLANVIGGLFIICDNLADLKNDHHGGTSSGERNQQDRYRKTLGRREHFPLHATLVIISFLIFGLLPPIVYGFAYRESDNRDYKLAAVGIASLVCIMLLAIGKAHVQTPPKKYISTIFYYISIGVAASGASYVAGDLIDKLLEKLGWLHSQPSSAVNFSFPASKPVGQAWAFY
ncbi:hypothetical protein Tsubulata_000038 [Turnera subulata]|uniref:C2H2-type domain-containing protein n=1 Tax=Turnera subulata TaxID=218843 RepID=A0A9Q0FKX5_9ROSI|nr:hypothetical protein Tsubulata_000038 [Turnera subulata]